MEHIPTTITTGLPASLNTEPQTKKDIALQKAGATREVAYKTMVEGLSATITKYDRDGDSLGEQPDYSTRLKSAELISRLNGDLKENVVDNRVVNISGVSAEAMSGLLAMVADVKEQLLALRTSGRQTGEIIDIETSSG